MANMLFNISLFHYLIFALFLFAIGFVGAIVSKNIFKILISIEFMLTAVNINLVANLTGYVFSLFYIALGAIELGIAISIFYLMYQSKKSVDINNYEELKG